MNYDELVRRLRERAERFSYDGWIDTAIWFEKAADAIEELQKDRVCRIVEHDGVTELSVVPRWIPVTERLPVYILDGEPLANMYLCYHVSEPMSWYQIDWWDGEKFVFKRQGRNDRVTHWMKPPAPPKEEHT